MLSTADGLGKELLDRRSNDEVQWSPNVRAKIVQVRHPYVFAFHKALERASIGAPGVSAPIARFETTPDLAQVREQMLKQAADFERTAAVIRANRIPLAGASKMINRNLFETWSHAVSPGGFGIFSNTGTSGEQEGEARVVREKRVAVVDCSVLLTAQYLETLDILTGSFASILVPQSVYEIFEECRQALLRHKDGLAASSTLALIKEARRTGKLVIGNYLTAIERLLVGNYRYITVDAELLTVACIDQRGIGEYRVLVDTLTDDAIDRRSAQNVVHNHLRMLVHEAAVWDAVMPYIDLLLSRIRSKYGRVALARLTQTIESEERLVTPNLGRLRHALQIWANAPETGIIVPPN